MIPLFDVAGFPSPQPFSLFVCFFREPFSSPFIMQRRQTDTRIPKGSDSHPFPFACCLLFRRFLLCFAGTSSWQQGRDYNGGRTKQSALGEEVSGEKKGPKTKKKREHCMRTVEPLSRGGLVFNPYCHGVHWENTRQIKQSGSRHEDQGSRVGKRPLLSLPSPRPVCLRN